MVLLPQCTSQTRADHCRPVLFVLIMNTKWLTVEMTCTTKSYKTAITLLILVMNAKWLPFLMTWCDGCFIRLCCTSFCMQCRFVNGNIYNRINTSIRFVSFLVAVCLLPHKMSQRRTFYTRCVFHADILNRLCLSYQYFRQGSIFVFRKILDRVGFQHQVGTYPYENDPPPPYVPWTWNFF